MCLSTEEMCHALDNFNQQVKERSTQQQKKRKVTTNMTIDYFISLQVHCSIMYLDWNTSVVSTVCRFGTSQSTSLFQRMDSAIQIIQPYPVGNGKVAQAISEEL